MKYIKFIIAIIFSFSFFEIKISSIEYDNESSDIPLGVETYIDGKNQLTHPSVISFEDEWNGYKYWMAYTPYPYANGGEENPSIAVSNDMLKWETPKGLANPVANNEELGCAELKDSHILYRDDLDRIEMWYLGRIDKDISLIEHDENQLTLFRKYSYDGIKWSDYEIMNTTNYLSPSIIWKDNKYIIWQIGFDTYSTTGTIQYAESKDGFKWDSLKNCSINGNENNIKIWHGSVSYNELNQEYEMVYIEDGISNNKIYYTKSSDGISFDEPITLLNLSKKWNRFYRPYLLFDNNYYLIYGVITDNNEWYLSMNKGEALNSLNKLTDLDEQKMINLEYPELSINFVQKLKECVSKSKAYIRYETYVFPFLFLVLYVLIKNINNYFLIVIQTLLIIIYCLYKFGFIINMSQFLAIVFMIITNALILLGMENFGRSK